MEATTKEPRFPYVRLDVEPEQADEVTATLFELGADGVEERDETTFIKGTPGKATLVASFGTHEEAEGAIASLAEAGFSAALEEVVGDAWRDEWKKYFQPFDLCEGLVIRPPWEPYSPKGAEHVIELEPGRAFGTGLHASTSLCAKALARHRDAYRGESVLDVGCGSGILALVALTFGASTARGVDIDDESARIANENAERNALSARATFDTTDVSALEGLYPMVLANIEAGPLTALAQAIMARVAPGGLLVLSGILLPQRDGVRAAYGELTLVEAHESGEWVALVLQRPRS
jgi:ribosomal protein L11 methyltransferase